MYAKGMTTSNIETHIQDIYGVAVSDTPVDRITDKILPYRKGMATPAAGGCLCSSGRARCVRRFRHVLRTLGQEVSQDFSVLEGKSGKYEHLFQVSSGASAADLYDQRHRALQPTAPESDQVKIRVSNR